MATNKSLTICFSVVDWSFAGCSFSFPVSEAIAPSIPFEMDFLREHHVEEGDNIQIIRKLKDALIVGVKGSRFAMGNEIAGRIQV